jgi:hypothetical protein
LLCWPRVFLPCVRLVGMGDRGRVCLRAVGHARARGGTVVGRGDGDRESGARPREARARLGVGEGRRAAPLFPTFLLHTPARLLCLFARTHTHAPLVPWQPSAPLPPLRKPAMAQPE